MSLNIRVATFVFLILTFSFYGKANDDYLNSLHQQALQQLKNSKNKDITLGAEQINIRGVPLLIALFTKGINESYVHQYLKRGGAISFTEAEMNFLCINGLYTEAIYLMQINTLTENYSNETITDSCLITAIERFDYNIVEYLLPLYRKKYDDLFFVSIDSILSTRTQLLESFIK